MHAMLYVGMAIMLLSFMGLIGLGCIAALLASGASDRGLTFLALAAFLVMIGLLLYGVVRVIQDYGG